MRDIFEVIVTAEDTQKHKPEPDVFLFATRRFGETPQCYLVFEDSPLGFTAADLAALDWIGVRGQ